MRRCIALVLFVVLLFCSCSSATVPPVSSGFCCRMTTEIDSLAVTAVLDRTDSSQTVISFEQPEALKGLQMIISGAAVQAKFGALSFDIPPTFEKEKVLAVALTEAFDALETQNGEKTDARFVFDEKSGVPVSYTVEDFGTTIFFTDWEVFAGDDLPRKR